MALMTIPEVVKMRLKYGLTQRGLSRMIKKDPTFMCKLESGDRIFRQEIQQEIQKTLAKLRSGK